MRVLADRAALESDVGHLARALPALVRTLRYGDVRGTDAGALAEVAGGMAERVRVGLPPACAGVDSEGAREMRGHLDAAHQAVNLLARDRPAADGAAPPDTEGGAAGDLLDRWRTVLRTLAGRDRVPGLLRGRCARLLLDDGQLADTEAERLVSLALSPGTPPAEAAVWIEGFLAGGGMLLVHDERLLALVDRWLTGVPADAFTDVLPLLRRTFAEYEAGVRRTLGELVRRGPAGEGGRRGSGEHTGLPGFGAGLEARRADAVLETVRLLLGTASVGGRHRYGGRESRTGGGAGMTVREESRRSPAGCSSPESRRTSGCGAGGWCWAAARRTAPAVRWAPPTAGWTGPWRRSTAGPAAAARPAAAAVPVPRAGSAPRRLGSRAGWATSAPTSPAPSSR